MSEATKDEVRARVRAARRARPDAERLAAAGRIAANAALLVPAVASDIACYVSTPTEPATDVLIQALRMAGHRVWVPRVTGSTLGWVRLEAWTEWTLSPLGIREPTGPAQDALPAGTAIVFMPALAAGRDGRRLGQGGGFYDRALAGVPAHADAGPLRVAVVFADEVIDGLPIQAHDVGVDAVVTD